MTVTHKSGVQQFDKAMHAGGSHCFEITPDEMPALEGMDHVETADIPVPAGLATTWGRIAQTIAQRGGYCLYSRTPAGMYVVKCVFPVPNPDRPPAGS